MKVNGGPYRFINDLIFFYQTSRFAALFAVVLSIAIFLLKQMIEHLAERKDYDGYL